MEVYLWIELDQALPQLVDNVIHEDDNLVLVALD